MKSDNARAWLSYVLAALLAAAGYFVLPMIYRVYSGTGESGSLLAYYLVNALQQLFLFAAPALLILHAREARWRRFCAKWKMLSADTAGYSMLLAVSCTVVVSLVVAMWMPLVESVLGYLPASTPLPNPQGAAEWLAALVCVAVVPAAAEELFFRGFLQTAVSKYFPRGAVWGVALVFAALHQDITALPGLFLMGWMLGRVTEKRGLLAAVLLHAMYNASVLLLNAKDAQIGGLAVWLCIFAFVFSVRRLMREEETHAADGSGM